MTQRNDNPPPSPIEQATAGVMNALNAMITAAHRQHRVLERQGITEQQFRSILAGYFTNKKNSDWCEDVGIDPPDEE